MGFPFKDLSFLDKKFRVYGLSQEDRYFQSLHDNMEPEFTRFCRSFIRKNYTCFDIGANIGLKSLIMASVADEGRVVAIEPGPTVGKVLDLTISANRAMNVVIEKAAVGDRTGGTVRFQEDSAFGFVGDAHRPAADGARLSPSDTEVSMTTLATLAKKHGLPRVDFIKMDVEGLEFPILRDALEFINSSEALVYFEFNAWAQMVNTNVRPKEFAKWVLENFSHVYLVKKGGDYGDLLSRMGRDDWFLILERNCFSSTFVDDLVVTNAPWRLDVAEAERNAAVSERNRAWAQWHEAITMRDAAMAERDAALAQLAALHESTSWKITSGLRAISRIFRPRS